MLTREIEVINCRNLNMAVLVNVGHKSLQMDENMGIKAYNFFRFGVDF